MCCYQYIYFPHKIPCYIYFRCNFKKSQQCKEEKKRITSGGRKGEALIRQSDAIWHVMTSSAGGVSYPSHNILTQEQEHLG